MSIWLTEIYKDKAVLIHKKQNRNNNKNANVDMESLDAQNKQRNLQHKEQNWRHCNI